MICDLSTALGGGGEPLRVSFGELLSAASPAFFFAAAEAVCEAASTVVVTTNDPLFSHTDDATLGRIITRLMSIPETDDRYLPIYNALETHIQTLRDQGTNARSALRSAFTIACLSPDVMGVGL